MITYENALVMSLTVTRASYQRTIRIAQVHLNDDTDGQYFIAGDKEQDVFRPCTQINILQTLQNKPDLINKKGVMSRIPVEMYSELAQATANNRLYCFLGRQNIQLRNMEFCDVLVDKYDLDRNGLNAVDVIDEIIQSEEMPKELFSLISRIQANTFLTLKAINIFRAILSYRSKYIPRGVLKSIEKIREYYPVETERELVFYALACMNCEQLKKRILDLKRMVFKRFVADTKDDKTFDGWEIDVINNEEN